MLRPAQVVAALDTASALTADEATQGEGAEDEQPEDRCVEDRVDRKAAPDWAERKRARDEEPSDASRWC